MPHVVNLVGCPLYICIIEYSEYTVAFNYQWCTLWASELARYCNWNFAAVCEPLCTEKKAQQIMLCTFILLV